MCVCVCVYVCVCVKDLRKVNRDSRDSKKKDLNLASLTHDLSIFVLISFFP